MGILKCAGGRFARAAVLAFFGALLAFQLPAQETQTLPPGVTRVQTVEGITQYQLANGLKVLLAPDLADERVTVNLTYLVGSRHEGYGESGMAHLLEHLIFKGSPNTPDPKAEFRKRGFTFNGTTSADRTNYYATFVSSQESLDWYIGWQADAMVNSFIAKKDLDSEMTVVRSEFEIAGNNPFATLSQRVMAAAYPWHNYGKPTIGNRADIENVDISRLQTFYKRYYRADNAVLMVAGKFDPAATLAAIQKSLGVLPRGQVPMAPTYTLEPVQDGERSVVVRRPASAQLMLVTYRAPAALHPDNMALTVLATALGDVPSGRLHKALVESKLAQAVFAGADRRREAGSVVFGTAFGPDDDPLARQKLLLDTIENLAKEPLRQDEFDRARARLEKNLELAFANAAAVAQGALQFEVLGDWRAVFVDRERMKA
ncbi:MAG: pitrilysin family protein, partial [Burkholderiales bacterium]|nr:pitrilysin family protein [Burkholderiales bacterium]